MLNIKGRIYLITIYGIIGIISAFYPMLLIPGCILLLFLYRKGQHLFFLLVLSLTFFFIHTSITEEHNHTNFKENPGSLAGKIKTIPVIEGDRLSFELESFQGESLVVFYRIKNEKQKLELQELQYGMICRLSGDLQEPSGRRNFYDFNYRKFLHYKKISWVFKPTSFSLKQCNEGKSSFLTWIYRFKQKQIEKIAENYPESIAGIVIALVFGDKNEVSDQVIKMYQQQGLIHLLAISGLHVGLVVGMIFFLLIRMGLTRERASILLVALIIPIYIVLTGAAPSIIRAGLMSILILLSYRFKLRVHPLDIISIVCLFQLVFNPYVIFNVGFQFSYLISFSLIVSSKKLLQSIYKPFHLTMIVTSISQLISLPLVLWTNYEFSLFSILLNMIFIPFISFVILPLSILSVLLINISYSISFPVIQVLKVLVEVAHELLAYISNLEVGNIIFGKPNILFVMMLYIAIVYLLLTWEKKLNLRWPIIAIFSILLLVLVLPHLNPKSKVTFIDVGQGDSILIELPYRKEVYLIDTGGQLFQELKDWQIGRPSFDPGKDVVVPFLKANGIRELSGLVLTHGDMDHVGGSHAVVKGVKVKTILGPKTDKMEALVKELLGEARIKPAVHYLSQGQGWDVEGQPFYVLHPKADGQYKSENDQSVVLWTKLYGVTFLFTGDMESPGEAEMTKAYPNLRAAILKVGHHGSDTSTSPPLLNTIQPKLAIISVGEHNRFGHPNQLVINRLEEKHVDILRTDELGAIQLVISKEGKIRLLNARD